MKEKTQYITTTLPYVNSDPHVGFATEIIRADAVARYKKLQGFEVFFNTGTDEHGLKIYQKAKEQGTDTQAYVDGYAAKFKGLIELLGLSTDIHFIRTTDAHHMKAAQEFWKRCDAAGDIYKKQYKIKYCVGCELEKTESELVDGKCPIHPSLEIQLIDEENYFFRFSKYQQKLLDLYKKNPDIVIPSSRLHEIQSFVERGLEDFSISRLKNKMPWGVPVPGDETQVMYVWFDALVNYISTLGWPENSEQFEKFWAKGNPIQYCGKDNLRQQSAMWQAMLFSAGINPTEHIVIDGFITGAGGVKMSKSLGNVINPYDVVEQYGTDALRYFVLRELHPFEDSPFTLEQFKTSYNANLANGLGNLVSRVLKMSENYFDKPYITEKDFEVTKSELVTAVEKSIEAFELHQAMDAIWKKIQEVDQYIQVQEPFKLFKTDPKKARDIVGNLTKGHLVEISNALQAFLPDTAKKMKQALISNKLEKPLFMRKE